MGKNCVNDISTVRVALHKILSKNTQYLEEHIRRRLRIANYPDSYFLIGKQESIIEFYCQTKLGIFYTLEDS